MMYPILFIFGLCLGSFLNVLALRYDGERFLFDPRMIGGRSHCPSCKKQLAWFELLPVISFLLQRGVCRGCGTKIGFHYPVIEVLVGALFAITPWSIVQTLPESSPWFLWLSVAWIGVFFFLVLLSYIDIRLGIIPDEIHIILGIFALVGVYASSQAFGLFNRSFLGGPAYWLGLQENVWTSHIVGLLFGFVFFEALVLLTRGRGMGLGDVKLAIPLGFLFGWPDILAVSIVAFCLGAIVGVILIAFKKKTMQGAIPFGPFLALGSFIVFLWGSGIVAWYVHLIR